MVEHLEEFFACASHESRCYAESQSGNEHIESHSRLTGSQHEPDPTVHGKHTGAFVSIDQVNTPWRTTKLEVPGQAQQTRPAQPRPSALRGRHTGAPCVTERLSTASCDCWQPFAGCAASRTESSLLSGR